MDPDDLPIRCSVVLCPGAAIGLVRTTRFGWVPLCPSHLPWVDPAQVAEPDQVLVSDVVTDPGVV